MRFRVDGRGYEDAENRIAEIDRYIEDNPGLSDAEYWRLLDRQAEIMDEVMHPEPGTLPWSKWTKAAILESAASQGIPASTIDRLRRIPMEDLKPLVLSRCGNFACGSSSIPGALRYNVPYYRVDAGFIREMYPEGWGE